MRRALLILLIALSICVVSNAQVKEDVWALIPDTCKAHIRVHGYGRSLELSIKCFFCTNEILEIILPDSKTEVREQLVDLVNESLGGAALMVYVTPYGSEYFWPMSFEFTQGLSQFSLSYSDVLALETGSPFSGGKLRQGTVTMGCIAIPQGIDLTKPFKIWYDDDNAMLGPCTIAKAEASSPSQATASQTLFLTVTSLDTTIKPGEVTMVKAQTLPQADCNITVYYESGVCESSDLEPKKANEDGIVYWMWRIDPDIEPGIVLIQVSATWNGEAVSQTASFEVIE